jgi:Cof subfamily protein (haloacid dehalogenase superfamily)
MSYKILFTDLDGTLLDGNSEISGENRAAAAEAFAGGKQFVVCSGRSHLSLGYFEKPLGLDAPGRYGVAFNGGVVYETLLKKILFEKPIDNATGAELAKTLASLTENVMVYAGDKLLAEQEAPLIKTYGGFTRLPVTYIGDFSKIKDDFIKIIIKGPFELLSEIKSAVMPDFGDRCNIFFSSETLLEFAGPETHKGTGMNFLIGYLGISPDETIAVGDQANDIEMLRAAGLGIAVANATPDVKAAADIVLDETNDESAVSRAIREWLI